MSEPPRDIAETPRAAFDRLLGELRPQLHRYCARMAGSVIDGEDIVQEALVKAIEAYTESASITHPEAWLFRIAHNAALDHLRRRARRDDIHLDEVSEMIADPVSAAADREIVATSVRTFMRLPVAQRSSVILMDVLGYTAQEIGAINDMSVPAVKAALHRGRTRLRELAHEPEDQPPLALSDPERARMVAYVDRFNARDFDALRNLLANDVRLELVNRLRLSGRQEVGKYFENYARVEDWQLAVGSVDGRPAIVVRDPDDAMGAPRYFVLLEWTGDRLAVIRDFRYARYVIDGAAVHILD